ncbi:MAG TPA: ergothioneine biosynthesis glutamate--cysteine ligase EgtA [Pseudonocardia sp.]
MSPKAIAQVVPGVAAQSESAARILRSQEEAEAYVASVCFKHGPPRLLGVELEWLLGNRSRPADPLDTQVLRTALGPYTPTSLDPRSAPATLPAGSQVTVEPGGQVELASKPQADLQSLVGAVQADSALLHTRLAEQGLYPHQAAADPLRPPRRILRTARYTAMEAAFDRLGTVGRSMMCSTAAVQPSVDLGERADLALRWQAVHLLGPVLVAAFANSPLLHGRRTGWKSSRMSVWLALDPPRTAPPELSDTDPAAGYARRVMQAEVICLRRSEESWLAPPGIRFADWFSGALPGLPSTADLDLHLSTMFPPVRPHGHVEVRYIDAQPGDEWVAPVAVLAALLSDRAVTSAAVDACLPVAGQWVVGARDGLADPAIARAAIRVFELAVQALPGLIGPGPVRRLVEEVVLRRVLRGRCPADADHNHNHTDNNHTAYDDARGGTR